MIAVEEVDENSGQRASEPMSKKPGKSPPRTPK